MDDYQPDNPDNANVLRKTLNAAIGNQRAFPGVPPGKPVTPSFLGDLQQQNEIIHLAEERMNALEQRLTAILPREPEQSTSRPAGVTDRLYTSAGASAACELIGGANDRLMRLNQRLERLMVRVEI